MCSGFFKKSDAMTTALFSLDVMDSNAFLEHVILCQIVSLVHTVLQFVWYYKSLLRCLHFSGVETPLRTIPFLNGKKPRFSLTCPDKLEKKNISPGFFLCCSLHTEGPLILLNNP